MTLDFHDPLASGTHLMTAVALVLPLALLQRFARFHSRAMRISVWVYAASAVSLYAASGLFHGIAHGPDRSDWSSFRTWQRLDQTAIFWLIFGSNVPLAVYCLRPPWAVRILATLGAIAVAGTVVLWFLPKLPHLGMVVVYLVMGAVSLVPIRGYYRRLGASGVIRIGTLAGLYIAGGVCEAVEWPSPAPPWFTYHEMLHLFDMAGTAAHFELLVWVVLTNPGVEPANLVDGPVPATDTLTGPA
jgi:hemolysin III